MNRVELSGRLTREPELRHVGESHFPILELNVAVDDADGRWNSQTKKSEYASGFYKVEARGDYAEALYVVLHKGDEVYVVGSLTQFRSQSREGGPEQTKTAVAAKLVVPLTGRQVENALPSPGDVEPF